MSFEKSVLPVLILGVVLVAAAGFLLRELVNAQKEMEKGRDE